jgi:hypothetical protein
MQFYLDQLTKQNEASANDRSSSSIQSSPAANDLPSGFHSLHSYFAGNKPVPTSSSTIRTAGGDGSTNSEVSKEEYLYDLKKYIMPSEIADQVMNENVQVMIGDDLYQVTRLGTFIVKPNAIAAFTDWYK